MFAMVKLELIIRLVAPNMTRSNVTAMTALSHATIAYQPTYV